MNLLYRKAVHTMKMIIPIKIYTLVKKYWGRVELGLSTEGLGHPFLLRDWSYAHVEPKLLFYRE